MPTRAEHIADIVERLAPRLVPDDLKAFEATRVFKYADTKLPVGIVYGTSENAVAQGRAWLVTYTIKIDLVIKADNGFDAITGPIMEKIKANLFGDPDWLGRWRSLPDFTVRQFRDADAGDAIAFETIVLNCTDVCTTSYPPLEDLAPPLEGLDVHIDHLDDDTDVEADGHDVIVVSENVPE